MSLINNNSKISNNLVDVALSGSDLGDATRPLGHSPER